MFSSLRATSFAGHWEETPGYAGEYDMKQHLEKT